MIQAEPELDTNDRRRVYDFVAERGEVAYEQILDSGILTEPERYRQIVAVLKRDGLLDEDDGALTTAVDPGGEERHEVDGVRMTIRPARQSDVSGVAGVIRQVTRGERYVVAETVGQQLSGDSTLATPRMEDRRFYVATVDGEVVGWCGLELPDMDKLSHTAELTLGVLEDYRGIGVGEHLMDRGLEWARDKGLHKVYNSVPSTNQAGLDFLERQGWKVEAVRGDHYRIDGEFVDEVMMGMRLD